VPTSVYAYPANVPPDFARMVTGYLEDSGDSPDMAVDGSTTPVVFSFDADPTDDIEVYEVRLMASVTALKFGGYFFSLDPLTNGLLFEMEHDDGTTTEIGNVTETEEFFMLSGLSGHSEGADWNRDVLVVQLGFGGKPVLKAGTSDQFRVTVRDDLNSTAIFYMKARFTGMKV